MLPEIVWNMPPLGTVNLHGSLLPQYRGAAPINWAVINGENETGVTTFKLKQAIDTGDILLQESFPIGEDETAGELHDRMKVIGAKLLVKTIKGIGSGNLAETPQSLLEKGLEPRHAPKIFSATAKIDWQKSTSEIHNLVRGLSPFPAAFTELDGKMLKIFRSKKEIIAHQQTPGSFHTDKKTYLKFVTGDGFLHVTDLQLESKKRMGVEEFLRGQRF
jgi:methionyl-tRNA formyltransferase